MWLITGGDGQLGRCLGEVLAAADIAHRRLGRADLDITDAARVEAVLSGVSPTVVVNAAGWTAVDDAEDREDEAFAANHLGVLNLARATRRTGATLVQMSTDYVFDGNDVGARDEDAPPSPASAYGRSKLAGEQAALQENPDGAYVVRTAWLYSRHGRNFAKTMVRRALAGEAVRVVNDQHGQPTAAVDLAAHLVDLVRADAPPGIYHGTNSGAATWFDMASAIFGLCGRAPSLVTPCSTADYPARAPRPANSVLGHRRTVAAGVAEMRDWRAALEDHLPQVIEQVEQETQ